MNLNRATLLSDALKKDETGPCQAQPAKTIRRKKSLKKPLTLRSDALQKDDERPAQPPDCALQAAAEPGQKYGSMAASPYRQMKKGQRRPHGVGPKDPKHGFFGALPLRQRGRRIFVDFGSDGIWLGCQSQNNSKLMEISSTTSKCITHLASLCLRLFRGLWSCDVLPLSSLLELPPKTDWFPASTKSGASLLLIVFCTIRNEYPLLV